MDNEHCLECGGELVVIKTPHFQHHGYKKCSMCGKRYDWVKTPKNEGKRTRTSIYDHLTPNVSHCGYCGRRRRELNLKETIHLHHSIPLEEGGPDELDNIIFLCTACHKYAHHVRLYFYIHPKETNNLIMPKADQ